MSKRKKLKVFQRTDRACDECHACCNVLGIQDLEKPAGEDCKHLDRSKHDGCTIYAQRPLDCQGYRCAWLSDAGFGGTEHRPDRIGVLFTVRDNKWEIAPSVGKQSLIAHETRPGAFEEPAAKKFMYLVAEHYIVLGFFGPRLDKCRAMGPADKLTAAFEWSAQRGYKGPIGILKGTST